MTRERLDLSTFCERVWRLLSRRDNPELLWVCVINMFVSQTYNYTIRPICLLERFRLFNFIIFSVANISRRSDTVRPVKLGEMGFPSVLSVGRQIPEIQVLPGYLPAKTGQVPTWPDPKIQVLTWAGFAQVLRCSDTRSSDVTVNTVSTTNADITLA
jgi:hypothetical protein